MDVRPDLQSKTKESEAIEVEVVEVDGITVPERPQPAGESPPPRTGPGWQQWQGKVMNLDSRWWPLWVFLGIIGVAILMTVGVVIGVIFVIFRIIKAILNAIFG